MKHIWVGLVVLLGCLLSGDASRVVASRAPGAPAVPETAAASPGATPATGPAADRAKVTARMSRLPMRFEANAGQWDRRVRFVGRGNGTTLFVTDDGMTFALREVKMPPREPGESREAEQKAREKALARAKTAAVTMRLVGVRPSAPRGEDELVTRSNFFLGNDPKKWRTNVPNYGRVRAKAWLPGVDMVWHGGPDGLEYDLAVSAGTDASRIAFDVEGADALRVRDDGTLEIRTAAGPLLEKAPRVTQAGKELRTRYQLEGARRVGFAIEGYDRATPVLIDPSLLYSTYLGGSMTEYSSAGSVAIDAGGSAYVTGQTQSTDFPMASPYQGFVRRRKLRRVRHQAQRLRQQPCLFDLPRRVEHRRRLRHRGRRERQRVRDRRHVLDQLPDGKRNPRIQRWKRGRVRHQAQRLRQQPRLLDLPRRVERRTRQRHRGRRERQRVRGRRNAVDQFPHGERNSGLQGRGRGRFRHQAQHLGERGAASTTRPTSAGRTMIAAVASPST